MLFHGSRSRCCSNDHGEDATVAAPSPKITADAADWVRGRYAHRRVTALHDSLAGLPEREAAMLRRSLPAPTALAFWSMLLAAPALADADDGHSAGAHTATPIKHVIVLIGENRSC